MGGCGLDLAHEEVGLGSSRIEIGSGAQTQCCFIIESAGEKGGTETRLQAERFWPGGNALAEDFLRLPYSPMQQQLRAQSKIIFLVRVQCERLLVIADCCQRIARLFLNIGCEAVVLCIRV